MLKIKKFNKKGRYLDIYIKKPLFNWKKIYYNLFNKYCDMENYNFDILLDRTNKYMILRFILRDKSDIEPYLKKVGDE